MTMPSPTPEALVTVEKVDIEMAASYYAARSFGSTKTSIAALLSAKMAVDDPDIDPLSYLFARHRIAATTQSQAREERLREALRDALAAIGSDDDAFIGHALMNGRAALSRQEGEGEG